MSAYYVIYSGCYAGVVKKVGEQANGNSIIQWIVEPEFTAAQAKQMAAKLNNNPGIAADELYESVGVGR